MKKSTIIITLILALAIASILLYQNQNNPESTSSKPIIKIGVILPLTGDMSNTGQSVKKGIEFAIEDINKNPNNKFIYKAIFEDNQMLIRNTVPIANKLISHDNVLALMTIYSGNAKAVAPLLISNRIIGLHGTYTDSILDGTYNFENLSTNAEIERSVISFINKQKPKKIAFAIQQTPASQEMTKNLKSSLKGIINDYDIPPSERDFKTLVYKIKQWNPDLVFISADLPVLDIFVKELQNQEVSGIKLGLDLINRTQNYKTFEGFYIINTSNGDKDFIQRFGHEATYYAPYFYDAVTIFYNAVEKSAKDSNIPSTRNISSEIHKLKIYNGAVGTYKILPNGKFETPMILYKIQNGKVIEIKE